MNYSWWIFLLEGCASEMRTYYDYPCYQQKINNRLTGI